ncbi:hypothetical protein HS1genome_1708 [Sulfodiicoccus acidiphilus]|uniref:Uncharacterized protein n=1 Tax=Sulfodiicoccus acidiphilus TaxID=1670455 RepID=A0A348B567_9CREN|nr:hypothetical protein HS1genome_1708 [Sulfodiicoccus acidiphilus]GGT89138.1 hypothetical protein GCM10007116_03710 [Sulfodiicoccus acidiphilus]
MFDFGIACLGVVRARLRAKGTKIDTHLDECHPGESKLCEEADCVQKGSRKLDESLG